MSPGGLWMPDSLMVGLLVVSGWSPAISGWFPSGRGGRSPDGRLRRGRHRALLSHCRGIYFCRTIILVMF